MRSLKQWMQGLTGLLFVVLLAASCTGADDSESALDDIAKLGSDVEASGGVGSEERGLVDLWAEYLMVYDEVITSNVAADSLAETVATTEAIGALEAQGEENRRGLDENEFNAIEEVSSSMNVVSVDAASATLRDCTTHTVRTALGAPFNIFADQEVRFVPRDGGWRIAEVKVLQDGWLGEQFGCVPQLFADEALRVSRVFQEAVLEFERDPSRPLGDDLIAAVSVELVDLMESSRVEVLDSGLYSESPTDEFIEVVGVNFQFASAAGPVVRVDSCVSYPKGQELRSVASGDVVDEVIAPGGSVASGFDVLVRDGFKGEIVAVVPLDGRVC